MALSDSRAEGELSRMQRELRLRDWRVRLLPDVVADPDDTATITYNALARAAQIRFADGWRAWTLAQFRHTLAHELFHLVWCDVWEMAERELDGDVFSWWRHYAERAIDLSAEAYVGRSK